MYLGIEILVQEILFRTHLNLKSMHTIKMHRLRIIFFSNVEHHISICNTVFRNSAMQNVYWKFNIIQSSFICFLFSVRSAHAKSSPK